MKILAQAGMLCVMLVATVLPMTAAHGATAPPAASYLSQPLCPDKAPEGGEYVRTVWAWPPPKVRASVKYRRPISVATMHRIRATLRHALNMAMRQDPLMCMSGGAGP